MCACHSHLILVSAQNILSMFALVLKIVAHWFKSSLKTKIKRNIVLLCVLKDTHSVFYELNNSCMHEIAEGLSSENWDSLKLFEVLFSEQQH